MWESTMNKIKMLIIAIVVVAQPFGSQVAQAHCDSLDGPVAKAAQKALENGNLNPVLIRRRPRLRSVPPLRSRAKSVGSALMPGLSRTKLSWKPS
jgi:hypothetical protein